MNCFISLLSDFPTRITFQDYNTFLLTAVKNNRSWYDCVAKIVLFLACHIFCYIFIINIIAFVRFFVILTANGTCLMTTNDKKTHHRITLCYYLFSSTRSGLKRDMESELLVAYRVALDDDEGVAKSGKDIALMKGRKRTFPFHIGFDWSCLRFFSRWPQAGVWLMKLAIPLVERFEWGFA